MKTTNARQKTLTFVMLLMLVLGTFLAGSVRQSQYAFDIGARYTADDVQAAREAFLISETNENLISFLKALCYRYKCADDESVAPEIQEYGQLLLNRAKAEEIDLQRAEPENVILQLLAVIRETGAR